MIGIARTATGLYPVRWSTAGVPTLLSTTQGYASGINDAGVIVGWTITSSTTYYPTAWDGATTFNLLKGSSYSLGQAYSINNAGKVAGSVVSTGFLGTGQHAASWTVTG